MVKVIRYGELISIFIVKNSFGNLALRTIINMSVTNQGNTRIKVGDWCTFTTLPSRTTTATALTTVACRCSERRATGEQAAPEGFSINHILV